MYIDVPWGQETIPVKIDPDRLAGVIEARTVDVGDEAAVLRTALENSDPPLQSFLDADETPLVCIVNDATRPTPTQRVLDILNQDLAGREIEFLVATGSHKAPNDAEVEQLLGREIIDTYRDHIHVHDARDASSLVRLGETSRGTPVTVNRLVAEAERLLLINSVEPHYFAGYTGGRKSIIPGAAGIDTIKANHELALDPASRNLALAGNPVHEDMMEAMQFVSGRRIYSIQMVLDRLHRIHSASCGDLDNSFEEAVIQADRHYVVDLDERYDVVVTVAPYPMDYDLYQSQKALENGAMALKEEGVIILVSKCRHGIGDETFFNLLASAATPKKALVAIASGYLLGYHKAAHMAHIAMKNEMWGVTDLDEDDMDAAFIRPFRDVQKAVEVALLRKGPEAKVLFLLDGSLTVPRVKDEAGGEPFANPC